MPESKVRKSAKRKQQQQRRHDAAERHQENELAEQPRNWVPYAFITVGLLGVLWLVLYNIAGRYIGFMQALGGWNVIIGMVLIIASFGLMTLWR
ncbi:MAG: septation inhibitor protein [Arachnia propionica]|nr:MAG: septation inhibitor protein [Arachnia propionica]